MPRLPTSQKIIEKAYATINDEKSPDEEKAKSAAFLHRELERLTNQIKLIQGKAQELSVFLNEHPKVSVAGMEENEKFRRDHDAEPDDDDDEDDDE